MFNAEVMLKRLQKVSENFPKYSLTTSASPIRPSHVFISNPFIQKHQKKRASNDSQVPKKLVLKNLKKKNFKKRPQKKPKCLELIHILNRKIEICDPSELKICTSRVIYSRPSSSRISGVCLSSRQSNYKSRCLEINLPKVSVN
jgi:hypothetical protein